MSIYQLKNNFQNLLRPLVIKLAKLGVTANQVTIFATVLSVALSVALFYVGPSSWWLCLPIAMFVRMALNAIDGMLAREHNMRTSLGFVLNELGDLVSDAAMYFIFIAVTGFNSYAVFGFILLAWLSEFVALLAFHLTQERANQGPLGKSDRAFLFGILGLLVAIGVDFSSYGYWVMLVSYTALIVTIYRRLKTFI